MNTAYVILLGDGTVGTVSDDTTGGRSPLEFDVISVSLSDENGNPIEVNGVPVEILERHS